MAYNPTDDPAFGPADRTPDRSTGTYDPRNDPVYGQTPKRRITGMQWLSLQNGGIPWDVPVGGGDDENPPGGGWRTSVDEPRTPGGLTDYVDTSLKPGNAFTYLPLSYDKEHGLRPAVPNIVRQMITGAGEGPQGYLPGDKQFSVPAVTINPSTGYLDITPEAKAFGSLAANPLGFSRSNPFVRPPPGTLTKPLPVTADELIAATQRAGRTPPPPGVLSDLPPPMKTEWAPGLAETKTLNDRRWNMIRDDKDAAVSPGYATKAIDPAIAKLEAEGPLSRLSPGDPRAQLIVRLNNARDQPITLGDFARYDSDLGGTISEQYSAGNNNTARILRDVQADMRQHFAGAGPEDVVGGQAAFERLDPARKTHTQFQKMLDAEEMIYKARLRGEAGGNEAGSMRNQMINYLASDASRYLTDLERAAYERGIRMGPVGTLVGAVRHMASPTVGAVIGGTPGVLAAGGARHGLGLLGDAIARARVADAITELGRGVPPPTEF